MHTYTQIHTYIHILTYIHIYIHQVQYILSDKTGTLTQNHMILQTFSIAATTYETSKTTTGAGSSSSSSSSGGSRNGSTSTTTGTGVLSMEEDLGLHKNSVTISPLMKTSSSRAPSMLTASLGLPLAGEPYIHTYIQYINSTCIQHINTI